MFLLTLSVVSFLTIIYNCAGQTSTPGSVRLVGSNSTSRGRLEVYHNGVWGTVCDDYFDDRDARVACFGLGFGYNGRFIYNSFGDGTGQIWLDNLHCVGNETFIGNCVHNGWGIHDCSHREDAAVECFIIVTSSTTTTTTTSTTQTPTRRPSTTTSATSTRLPSTTTTTRPISTSTRSPSTTTTTRPISTSTRSPSTTTTVAISIRLAGSNETGRGRVEVYYQGEWGTVCDDFFDDVDARVVCFMMGYGYNGRQLGFNVYPGATGRIWLDSVECSGSETSIADCGHDPWGHHDCSHSEDTSVQCLGGQSSTGTPATTTVTTPSTTTTTDIDHVLVRLAGSNETDRGRVEVYYQGEWGTVCDDEFDDVDAGVICFMLGFGYNGRQLGYNVYPGAMGRIWLDSVECGGWETSIANCRHAPWGRTDCSHSEDASVQCGTNSTSTASIHISTPGSNTPPVTTQSPTPPPDPVPHMYFSLEGQMTSDRPMTMHCLRQYNEQFHEVVHEQLDRTKQWILQSQQTYFCPGIYDVVFNHPVVNMLALAYEVLVDLGVSLNVLGVESLRDLGSCSRHIASYLSDCSNWRQPIWTDINQCPHLVLTSSQFNVTEVSWKC